MLVGCDGLSRLSEFGIAKSILATHRTAENRLVGKLRRDMGTFGVTDLTFPC